MLKKIHAGLVAAVLCTVTVLSAVPPAAHAENPIAQNVYTSDPAPLVVGDTCYVYTGHDADNSTYFTMPDWKCYSSTDMRNWTDHGTILSGDDFAWAEENTA